MSKWRCADTQTASSAVCVSVLLLELLESTQCRGFCVQSWHRSTEPGPPEGPKNSQIQEVRLAWPLAGHFLEPLDT